MPLHDLRAGVLALARGTGWSRAEIGAMTARDLTWWLEGLTDGKPEA
ncbi:hypothetical protein [Paracoccus homiensis]|nr:hypothetical protein [Paracoccus homiensis]